MRSGTLKLQDREERRTRLEAEILDALQSKVLTIGPEELDGRSLVAVLREKLAKKQSS
jgi:hypothetical protein